MIGNNQKYTEGYNYIIYLSVKIVLEENSRTSHVIGW